MKTKRPKNTSDSNFHTWCISVAAIVTATCAVLSIVVPPKPIRVEIPASETDDGQQIEIPHVPGKNDAK